jgi:hypothetical protein
MNSLGAAECAIENRISILAMLYSKADKPRRGSMRSDKSAMGTHSRFAFADSTLMSLALRPPFCLGIAL